MDEDDPNMFGKERQIILIKEKIAYTEFFLLTPLPGTEFKKNLKKIIEFLILTGRIMIAFMWFFAR